MRLRWFKRPPHCSLGKIPNSRWRLLLRNIARWKALTRSVADGNNRNRHHTAETPVACVSSREKKLSRFRRLPMRAVSRAAANLTQASCLGQTARSRSQAYRPICAISSRRIAGHPRHQIEELLTAVAGVDLQPDLQTDSRLARPSRLPSSVAAHEASVESGGNTTSVRSRRSNRRRLPRIPHG